MNRTHTQMETSANVYIYIYMCVCVCVCVYAIKTNQSTNQPTWSHLSEKHDYRQIIGK